VKADSPGSHSEIWAPFTEHVCKTLTKVKKNLIWLAWGKQAQSFMTHVDIFSNFVLMSDHPSKAAKEKQEWKTNDFSMVNTILTANKTSIENSELIKW
jgi:uracil-DNA glycosylase